MSTPETATNRDPRYPVGKFALPDRVTAEERARCLEEMTDQPAKLREAIAGLTAEQFETPYRDGGWTVRQVVHHIPDSHLNGYVKFKLALTEDVPTIKPYDQALWAELPDAHDVEIDSSLDLLDALHRRWVKLLRAVDDSAWSRTFRHPEFDQPLRLDANLALYTWHGRHHTAQITSLRERMGW